MQQEALTVLLCHPVPLSSLGGMQPPSPLNLDVISCPPPTNLTNCSLQPSSSSSKKSSGGRKDDPALKDKLSKYLKEAKERKKGGKWMAGKWNVSGSQCPLEVSDSAKLHQRWDIHCRVRVCSRGSIQGGAKRFLQNFVTHIPSGLMGCTSAALWWGVEGRRELKTCRKEFFCSTLYTFYSSSHGISL